jgi:peptidoglycan hydrolase-like protein with peptidoglycan-binding domain
MKTPRVSPPFQCIALTFSCVVLRDPQGTGCRTPSGVPPVPLRSEKLAGNAVLRQVETKARKGLGMGRATNDTTAVRLVQEALKSLGEDLGGDWVPPSSGLGWYGQHTVNAVYSFQSKIWPTNAAEWDGVVGQKTLRALDAGLLGGVAPQPGPNPDGGGAQPPPGVLPTESDWRNITFDPPLFISFGYKVSIVDPIFMPIYSRILSEFGVHLPHGGDVILASMRRIVGTLDLGNMMMTGELLGVTTRGGALPLTLPQATEHAKKLGAGAEMVKVLEGLSNMLGGLPSAAAISLGAVLIVATGFPNVAAMHGYKSGPNDEATFNFAIGSTKGLSRLLQIAIERGGNLSDLINAGGAIYETCKNLSDMKQKAIVVMDVPFLSIGVDVGFSASRTSFYSLDYEALTRKIVDLVRAPTPTIMAAARPGLRVMAPQQGIMRVRRPI